jgi:GR25 family glycosyltransferase involved in LPS biosynthesis
MSEISLLLKHCLIVKDAYENGYNSILVFEDDVVLEPNFTERLNNYISQLPQDWDSCWVGSCCGLHAPYIEGINVYKMDGSRCTHAFLLSKSGIYKIVNDMKFANDPADWYYNMLILKHNLNNYWFEPPLAYQNLKYKTTIQ